MRVKADTRTVYEVLAGACTAGEALTDTRVKRLSLLPADIRLAGAELELTGAEQREYALREALASIRDRFDYVFIDCPPSLGLITVNALCAADSVLVPIQCEYYALEGVTSLMGTVSRVQKTLNRGLEIVSQVKKHFKGKVFSAVIPRNVRLGEAPSHGLPIHLYDPRSSGAEAYTDLAVELVQRNKGAKR